MLKRRHGLNRCLLCEVCMDIEKALDESRIVSIEAVFELDSFDPVSQKAFEDLLDDE